MTRPLTLHDSPRKKKILPKMPITAHLFLGRLFLNSSRLSMVTASNRPLSPLFD